ncbi:unnamed protein product [Durusdinium trenchii]|uniref:J domain-containing protein n=2 Tax=Durusdinium trenchii TaxID=1381693 RepID=A0ABP0Q9V0_9DINO
MADGLRAAAHPNFLTLDAFLAGCNKSWGARDLHAVQRKLEQIGVSGVPDLLRYERSGVLNDLLAAAGQKTFSPATLAAFRAAEPRTGFPTSSTQLPKTPEGVDGYGDDSSDVDELEELLNDFFCRASAMSSRPSETRERVGFDEATLRRQVNRGLAYIDEAAKEVHTRNANLSRCLEEVQADISRISERMQAARRERQRGRAATSAVASRMFAERPQTFAAPSNVSRKYVDETPRRPKVATKAAKAPEKQSSRGFTPPCPRAAKEGFSFGGWHSLRPQPLVDPQQSLQESVRAQLASLKYESKANQKAAVKRLLVKWHPDRNLERAETATSIFQFIQQEKDKMFGPL